MNTNLDKRINELLAKYFRAYRAYDGETEQTVAAIKALITEDPEYEQYMKGA